MRVRVREQVRVVGVEAVVGQVVEGEVPVVVGEAPAVVGDLQILEEEGLQILVGVDLE